MTYAIHYVSFLEKFQKILEGRTPEEQTAG